MNLADADFTNVTNVQTLTTGLANAAVTVVLEAQADEAGITTVTGNGSGIVTATIHDDFDNALTVNLGTGADTVDANTNASAAAVTVSAALLHSLQLIQLKVVQLLMMLSL